MQEIASEMSAPGAGEMTLLVKCLPCRHIGLNSTPEPTSKSRMWWYKCIISALGKGRQADPQGSVAS